MSQGKVYLVGAGPGDVGLITLKGYQLICEADVILHDHLIPVELLNQVKSGAEIISVGKFASRHTLSQDEINKLIIEKAKQDKIVVRLKGGDPYLFGRGGEEAEACAKAGVDFEVVPGISSALAAPCYAGIPPTHRDYTSSVAIVTGHRKKEDLEIEIPDAGTVIFLMGVSNIERIVIPKAGTIIFLMGVSNLEKIIDSLLKAGRPNDTRIAAIEHGTCYDQRVVKGCLGDFLEIAAKAKLRTPGIFIVGKVVELQEKLNWFTRKPNVLVLGNHPQRYNYLGNIVHRRIIDCVGIDDYSRADAVIKQITDFDWVVFTSVNGAKFMFERLYGMGLDCRCLGSVKIAAIGKTTAQRLLEFGLRANMVPEIESSAGLLGEFIKLDMKGRKVFLPQSEIASSELPDGLLKMKAVIEKVPVYKTVELEPDDVDFDYIDQVLFTSGSTVRAFIKKFKSLPANVKAYALGPPTQAEAKKHGIDAEIVPSRQC